jgi:hypothetical protein
MGSDTELVKEALSKSIRIKSSAWKYEREYRMLTNVTVCAKKPIESGKSADFISFKREWVNHVDFGLRVAPAEIQTMKDFLKKEYPHVHPRQATFHSKDYAVEYKLI